MHKNAAASLQRLVTNVSSMRDNLTHFGQGLHNESMKQDSRAFFKVYVRNLGRIYAKAEEIQEIMPIHASFRRQAVDFHKQLLYTEARLRLKKCSKADNNRSKVVLGRNMPGCAASGSHPTRVAPA